MAIFTALAIAGFLGVEAASGIAVVTAFVLNAAVSLAAAIGVPYAAKALSGNPNGDAASTIAGIQGKLSGGGDVPRSFILGTYNTAGSLVYANTWTPAGAATPNAYLVQVIALSDLPCQGLLEFWVNGQKVTINGDSARLTIFGNAVDEYFLPQKAGDPSTTVDHLWIKFYDGTQTTADPNLVDIFGTDPDRPYNSGRVGKGITYVIIGALVNDNIWSGIPTFKFTIKGSKLYDPSKDDTNGGTGSQRYDDPTTWGGDGDDFPAVQLYNLLRGFSYNGAWLYGLQTLNGARLPADNWVTQINKCRVGITGENGTEATYRSAGQFDVSAKISDTGQALLTACQGRLSEIGGVYKLYLGAPDDSVFSFDDDSIISTQTQSFVPFFGLADTINGITGKFPDPSQAWSVSVAPPLFNSTYETQDGSRRLLADVSFDYVPYAAQVQRLMKSALLEARRARRNTITLPPEFWILEPGDIITWTSNRNGFDNKLFRIDGMIDNPNLDVVVDLTEVDPTDYSWTHGTDFKALNPGGKRLVPPGSYAVLDWTAEGVTIYDADGIGRRAAIQLGWDNTVKNVAHVAYEVRQAWDQVVILRGSTPNVEAGDLIISQNILPKTNYEARGQYIPISPRDSLWSDWLACTTPDISISLADFDSALHDLVTNSINDANKRIAEIADLISEVTADQDAANKLDKHTVRSDLQEVAATTNSAVAATSAQISVVQAFAATTQAAFSSYQITTNVTLGSLSSNVTTLQTTTATTDATVASLTTTVTANFGTLSASVTVNSTAIATIGGKLAAQYLVSLDVNGFVSSLKAYNDGSFSSWTFVGSVFQVAFPGVSGGDPTTIFQIGTVNGSPAIVLKGNFYADGTVATRMLQAGLITAASGAIDALAVKSLNIQGSAVTVPVADIQTSLVAGGSDVGANAVNVVIDTAGLSGSTISILINWSFLMSYSGGSATLDSNTGIWVNGVKNFIVSGNTTQINMSMQSLYSFTADGTVMTISVTAIWGANESTVSIGKRVLSCLAVKR